MLNEMIICAVRDKKASAFAQPFVTQNRETAIRSFAAAVNQEGHQFHHHAEDYTLYVLATFDEATGHVVGFDSPEYLGAAVEYTRQLAPVLKMAEEN